MDTQIQPEDINTNADETLKTPSTPVKSKKIPIDPPIQTQRKWKKDEIIPPGFYTRPRRRTRVELKAARQAQEKKKKDEEFRKSILKKDGTPDLRKLPPEDRVLNLNFPLSTRQKLAMNAEEQFVMYGGAKGGGKSWWICVWIFCQALKYRGNKLFFFRRRSVDFTNTTLETWRKVIPGSLYRINEQKKKIIIPIVDSSIDFGGLDDPLLIQSLNSAEYGGGGVDQAEEIEKDSFGMLRGTLRHRLPDGTFPTYQIRLTANPAQCWLKDDFITMPKDGFRFIPALPSDNPFLPRGYVDNLREAFSHRPALLSAYLDGSWDDLSGHDVCIQPSLVEHSRKKSVDSGVIKRIIVNDPARFGDDENVSYVMEQTPTCSYSLEGSEMIMEHKSLMDTAGRLSSMRKKYGANLIAVDSIGIGAGIVDALNDLGEYVLSINSSAKPTAESKIAKYYNLRAQMWMEAGLKFSEGKVKVHEDNVLQGQLSSVKFKFQQGKIICESKDDIKKRLQRSPDRADAFVMGLYALDKSDRLDSKEYEEKTTDRSFQGTLVDESHYGIEDFSGYTRAQ